MEGPPHVLARSSLKCPHVGMESIGAASGTIIKIDPQSGRSAGAGETLAPRPADRSAVDAAD